MTKIPDAPKHIPITNDRYTAKEYEGLPEKTAEVAGHEPEHMAKVWGKVAGDGYISRADAGKLNRAMGDISVFGHELHDGTDTVEAEFMALRLSKSDVKWDPEVRKAYEGELAARNLQMEKGAVLTGSFTHEGTVHELTEGFVDMPYDKFLELMPADKWGVNLAEYRGGEVKITAKDEQGRVTRQRERMVLESPLSKLLPGVFEANDMTKVESITHGDGRGQSYTTTYAYSDGLFDWEDRDFRGFGYVKATDPAGTVQETWFHQDDVFKGNAYRQEVSNAEGRLLKKVESSWDERELSPGVRFPFLKQVDEYTYSE